MIPPVPSSLADWTVRRALAIQWQLRSIQIYLMLQNYSANAMCFACEMCMMRPTTTVWVAQMVE